MKKDGKEEDDLRLSEVKDEETSRHLPMELSIEMEEMDDNEDDLERDYGNNNLE